MAVFIAGATIFGHLLARNVVVSMSSAIPCLSLAYKTVIYEDLPDEVLSYADAHNFPIYKYTDSKRTSHESHSHKDKAELTSS